MKIILQGKERDLPFITQIDVFTKHQIFSDSALYALKPDTLSWGKGVQYIDIYFKMGRDRLLLTYDIFQEDYIESSYEKDIDLLINSIMKIYNWKFEEKQEKEDE